MEQIKVDKFTKEELKDFIIGLCIVFIAFAVGIIYKWQNTVWADAKNTDYALYATFNRTDGLEIGSKVRMAGIDIGYVEDSVLDENFRATLTFKVKENIEIPDDSSAAIVSTGVMGSKYIEIEPGGSEDMLPAGGEFLYTQDAMVLEELVDRIISMGKANRKKESAPTQNLTDETEKNNGEE